MAKVLVVRYALKLEGGHKKCCPKNVWPFFNLSKRETLKDFNSLGDTELFEILYFTMYPQGGCFCYHALKDGLET